MKCSHSVILQYTAFDSEIVYAADRPRCIR